MQPDIKKTISANVQALMVYRWGKVNISRLGREIGQGGAQRLVYGRHDVGVELVEKAAKALEVMPYHLMIPGLDPANPPVLIVTEAEQKLYRAFNEYSRAIKGRP